MKKAILLFLCCGTLTIAHAQAGLLGRLKSNTKDNSRQTSQPITKLGIPVSLDIGIDTREVPLAGSVGSGSYKAGIQAEVRKSVYANKDATRYLTNAVKENNAERVAKLLEAGASAYIDYDMVDKKQYEIMDLMYKNNPMLVRYSQLLHYACANSDSTMVDFLIDRGASLDLCGYYLEKLQDNYWGWMARIRCEWNDDAGYDYTPQDNALRQANNDTMSYIIRKYGKYPTAFGYADYIYWLIGKGHIEWTIWFLNEGVLTPEDYDTAVKTILNTPYISLSYHNYNTMKFSHKYMLVKAIEKLGEYRRKSEKEKAEQCEQLVRLMIEKGADVNLNDAPQSILDIGIGDATTLFKSPMLAAMSESNMLDIIKLLKKHGASMTIKFNKQGKNYEVPIEKANIKDEYKELLLIGEL